MNEQDRQYKEKMKNSAEKFSEAAKEKAKKEGMKKIIRMLGIKGIAIIVLIVLLSSIIGVTFLAGAVMFDNLNNKEKATLAKESAIGNEALNKIITMEDGKYKISYNGKTGKQAIEAILEDNDMNFEDFNDEEIECLYKCLKAEWATTYPNLGGQVDNNDINSEYVQGVITIQRGTTENQKSKIIPLSYKPYEEFTNIKDSSALNYFSMKDGNIIVASWSSNETIYTPSDSMPNDIKNRLVNIGEQITITETAIDYRDMIGIYQIPFELLLSLLIITEDIDFVSELADLGFNSKLEFTVYDNTTVITTTETEHMREEITYKKYGEYHKNIIIQEISKEGKIQHQASQSGGSGNTGWFDSAEKNIIDYTLTTKEISKSNSYVIGLTNINSWISDLKNEYTYNAKVGVEEDLGLGKPFINIEELEEEEIPLEDSEILAKVPKETVSTKVDSSNDSTTKTTTSSIVTLARKRGTANLLTELTKNTSKTDEYKYEAGNKTNSKVGEKFKGVYDNNPKAQAQLDSVDSWLFEMLEDTESTVDYVSIIKYLLFVCTDEDFGVSENEIQDLLDVVEEKSFINVSNSSSFEQFKRWLRSREGTTGISDDGTKYKVGLVQGNRTVGYGIDLETSGKEEEIKKMTGKTTIVVGDWIDVEIIDKIEEDCIKQAMKDVKELTNGLNLAEYQIYALVSRVYNCGKAGAFGVGSFKKNGKTWKEAYQAYWKKEDDEYGVNETKKMFQNEFYLQHMQYPTNNGTLVTRREAEWLLFKTGYFDTLKEFCNIANESSDLDNSSKSNDLYNSDGSVNLTKLNSLEEKLTKEVCNVSGKYMKGTGLQYKQCTWWAYSRASEYLGKPYPRQSDGRVGNGGQWYDINKQYGWFEYGTQPRENSIVCWWNKHSPKYGHVAYVEAVDSVNQKIYVSHAGGGKSWYGIQPLPWSGYFDGANPNGYIYLDSPKN